MDDVSGAGDGFGPRTRAELETEIQNLHVSQIEANERHNATVAQHQAEKVAINARKDRIIADKQAMIDEGIAAHGNWRARAERKALALTWWMPLDQQIRDGQVVSPGSPEHELAIIRAAKINNYSRKVAIPGLRFGPEREIIPAVDDDPMKNFEGDAPFRLMDLFFKTPTDTRPRLPILCLTQILCELLVKPGGIHVLSRFDSFANYPFRGPVYAHLPHRFFWGDGVCSINGAHDPGVVLAVLRVNKLWLELGANVFYGINTFKFSSLGELGRFFKYGGDARMTRIQKIELMWIGSLMYKIDGSSTRSLPLLQLSKLINLKSVRIYINEDWPQRQNEVRPRRRILENATVGELKEFKKRALPTIQGLAEFRDQIRGLSLLEFYKHKSTRVSKLPVQDQAFVAEIRALTTRPKKAADAEGARAENLPPILNRRFNPWERQTILRALEAIMEWVPGVDDQDSDNEADDEADDEDEEEDPDPVDDSDPDNGSGPNGSGPNDGIGHHEDDVRMRSPELLVDADSDEAQSERESLEQNDDVDEASEVDDNPMFFPDARGRTHPQPMSGSASGAGTPERQSEIPESRSGSVSRDSASRAGTPEESEIPESRSGSVSRDLNAEDPDVEDSSDGSAENEDFIMSTPEIQYESPLTPATGATPGSQLRSKRNNSESPGARAGRFKRQRMGENSNQDEEDMEESAQSDDPDAVDEGNLADEEDTVDEEDSADEEDPANEGDLADEEELADDDDVEMEDIID